MLRHLHLLHGLTQGSAVTGAVLADDPDLLRSLGLQKKAESGGFNLHASILAEGSEKLQYTSRAFSQELWNCPGVNPLGKQPYSPFSG